jgi:hypothetical protein
MSALDYNGNTTTQNTTRFYEFTAGALGTGDWCCGAWHRAATGRITGLGNQTIIAMGTADAADSVHLRFTSADGYQAIVRDEVNTAIANLLFGSALTEDNLDRLYIVQRRSNVIEAYMGVEGTTKSVPDDSTGTISMTSDSSGWRVGSMVGSSNYMEGPLGEAFLLIGDSLTAAEVTTLLSGKQITYVKPSATWHLPLRSGEVASEPNLGSAGGSATRNGTGYAEVTNFFELGGAGVSPMYYRKLQVFPA